MDRIDRQIIAALQRDGRQKLAQLSEEVGLMQTPNIRSMRSSFALRTMIRRSALPQG